MKYCKLTPTALPTMLLVKSVQTDPYPNPGPYHDTCPDEVEGGYTWSRDAGVYRLSLQDDFAAGWTNQEKIDYAKRLMDQFYWPYMASCENPFDPGREVWPVTSAQEVARTNAINDVKARRRAYLDGGGSDATVDAILAAIVPFYQALVAAYPLVWADVKSQSVLLDDIPTDPRWPAVPAFIGTPDADAPSVEEGAPPGFV